MSLKFYSIACMASALLVLCSCKKEESTTQAALEQGALPTEKTTAIPVSVSSTGMMRAGQPYYVKGAGGAQHLAELAKRGGNSVRTWSTKDLGPFLDQAHTLDLTVSAGIWLEKECSWFSYTNPQQCAEQEKRVREEVLTYRDHPALLAWGIGNESEGDGSDTAYWMQLNRLALAVKEVDPHHPTFTALAGCSEGKASALNQHTPDLDFVGINTYGAVFGLRKQIEKIGWKRPWLLSEWGSRGFWETNNTAFDAPLEQTSSEKAKMMQQAYRQVLSPDGGCLGNYAFVWGWKFEATATWFGLFTFEGESTPAVDVLEEMWTGRPPLNRAPEISPISHVPKTTVARGEKFQATATASDSEGDTLTWKWKVLPELKGHKHNTNRKMPKCIEGLIDNAESHSITVSAPSKPGIYRLYCWVYDDKGHAATANQPFQVR